MNEILFMENRFYILESDRSLITRMEEEYGSYRGKEGLLSKRIENLSSHPHSRSGMGIFIFERGSKSAIINEGYPGILKPANYHSEIVLIGEKPNNLKKRLEKDLEIEFDVSKK